MDLNNLTDRQFWSLVASLDWRAVAELDPPAPGDIEAMLVNLERRGRVIRFPRRT